MTSRTNRALDHTVTELKIEYYTQEVREWDYLNVKAQCFSIPAPVVPCLRAGGGHEGSFSLMSLFVLFQSTASSDADYGGGVQLQGCCSQSSLNSNSSLPGAGSHKRLSERRVASWAACFERLLQDPIGVCYFSEFLKKEFSEENILFWQACEYFSQVPATDKKQLSQRAGEIYNSFLSSKATTPVNIDSQAHLADDVLTSPCPNMFKAQQLQVKGPTAYYIVNCRAALLEHCYDSVLCVNVLLLLYSSTKCFMPSVVFSNHLPVSKRAILSTLVSDRNHIHSSCGPSIRYLMINNFSSLEVSEFYVYCILTVASLSFLCWVDSWGSNGRRESQGSLSSGASLELATSCSTGKTEVRSGCKARPGHHGNTEPRYYTDPDSVSFVACLQKFCLTRDLGIPLSGWLQVLYCMLHELKGFHFKVQTFNFVFIIPQGNLVCRQVEHQTLHTKHRDTVVVAGDNRHSVPVWERVRECSKICSMTLPDGSCSSVTLRPGATIREVLRDLCQSLRINMAAVDLFLVGGEKPLVLDQDCMTLSARNLRMEKRTLFRLDLVPINRSVGLKAKPTKPVTEVLRPVVAKYGLHLKDLVAKISGETEPLDLGAPISSLDGLRVVLERADPVASGKDSKSKSGSLKAHPPSLTTKSLSATTTRSALLLLRLQGDDRSSGKASGPDPSLPVEKGKPKKINIDEAEEFFELLSRAQSNRRNDQRGLLNKEDLELPDFLRLTSGPPSTASLDMACSTPTSIKQGQGPGRENGVGAAGRRALLPPTRLPVPPFSAALSPIPRPSESRGPALRTLEEDTHADLTLVGEGDITSPNSTLLAPALLSHEGSLPEGNFLPPSPCANSFHDGGGNGQSSSGISPV
ncbi:unnamed protein product [Oncorhynchus mykiss]|uniref:Regulator of G protein signaling 12a n=1 Tax=Oncorhynchus mykiss TaxID=8022 RepID=A0A060WB27_ONCMY|nr:unnamed protein product [Oncorhynchus mykiss]